MLLKDNKPNELNNKPRVFAYLDSEKANSSILTNNNSSDSAKLNLTGDTQIGKYYLWIKLNQIRSLLYWD